jgi:hypothetical protein
MRLRTSPACASRLRVRQVSSYVWQVSYTCKDQELKGGCLCICVLVGDETVDMSAMSSE